MKKLILTFAIIMVAGAAHAVTPYVSLKVGYMDNTIEGFVPFTPIDESIKIGGFGGPVGSAAVGIGGEVDPFVALRGELEYSYARTWLTIGPDSMDINAHAFMVNGYADLGDKSWTIKPYIGLGLGYSFGNTKPGMFGGDSTNGEGGLAYSYAIGATYAFNPNFTLDASVKRWINNGSTTDPGVKMDTKYTGTSCMLGGRYSF